uniref:Uncharacterized protein n=1 Tax=Trichobilharzia regenti TaxID=157069 RepID=A0AA85IZT4_TRIRE|nr:unnamed protein product [Trichobilharzia regenti]
MTLKPELTSILWFISIRCLAIDEVGSLTPASIGFSQFICFSNHFGICSPAPTCKARLLIPMYVFQHTRKLLNCVGCGIITCAPLRFAVELISSFLDNYKPACITHGRIQPLSKNPIVYFPVIW